MNLPRTSLALLFCILASPSVIAGQEPSDPPAGTTSSPDSPPATAPEEPQAPPVDDTSGSGDPEAPEDVLRKAGELAQETQSKVEELAGAVDQNESARKASAGLLGPIYQFAEYLSFSSFHWCAFALMAAGVVGYALQIVPGKLVLLLKGSLNLREILSDAIGLLISVVGLVLTTQAAAENSGFTHSPSAVLSAAAAGVIAGFVLYRWGQAQEVQAVHGRRAAAKPRQP